jgi:hypothetical protein
MPVFHLYLSVAQLGRFGFQALETRYPDSWIALFTPEPHHPVRWSWRSTMT